MAKHKKVLTQKEIEQRAEYAALLLSDIQVFAEDILPSIVTHQIPAFHSELYSKLPVSDRLIVAAPRGFAKSKISSVIYPIWLACTGHKKEIVIISASETLAKEMLRQIKLELESNQKILQLFGDIRTDKWSETHIITSTGVSIRARGAGGQIRGFRPDCLLFDDIETDETVKSEEQRKKLKDWMMKAAIPTLTPGGQMIMVGSIIYYLALLNDLLDAPNGWTKMKILAYKDFDERAGNETWPELWDHEKLQQRKKDIGSWAFAAEYMNNPVSDATAPIRPEQIRYWTELPDDLSCVIAVDPAYSEDEKADYKVASLVGMDTKNNRFMIHYIRTHASSSEFFNAIINLWQQNRGRVTSVGIPNSGTEKSFFESFIKYSNEHGVFPPVVELKNTFLTASGQSVRNKRDRVVAALQPLFEQGKYFINESHMEVRDELLTIGSSRWDDLVDSMAYAESIISPSFMTQADLKSSLSESGIRPVVSTNYGY